MIGYEFTDILFPSEVAFTSTLMETQIVQTQYNNLLPMKTEWIYIINDLKKFLSTPHPPKIQIISHN